MTCLDLRIVQQRYGFHCPQFLYFYGEKICSSWVHLHLCWVTTRVPCTAVTVKNVWTQKKCPLGYRTAHHTVFVTSPSHTGNGGQQIKKTMFLNSDWIKQSTKHEQVPLVKHQIRDVSEHISLDLKNKLSQGEHTPTQFVGRQMLKTPLVYHCRSDY